MYGRRNKKPAITVLDRKDITDYVRAFTLHMREKGHVFDTRHEGNVRYMVELMNKPENTTFKSVRDLQEDRYYWDYQKVDFVRSNLKRGFIFYFVCNGCGRRVKYLYEYSVMRTPLCRICCRLDYEPPTRKARELSRLIRKPYLSSEAKYALIKKAGITEDDVRDSRLYIPPIN
jgi:hypothetical protein